METKKRRYPGRQKVKPCEIGQYKLLEIVEYVDFMINNFNHRIYNQFIDIYEFCYDVKLGLLFELPKIYLYDGKEFKYITYNYKFRSKYSIDFYDLKKLLKD